MLVERTGGRGDQRVILSSKVGNPEFADTEIDVFHTGSVPGHIQVEVIVRVDIETVIEPLASPERDLGGVLEDVAHFEERLPQDEAEVGSIFFHSSIRCHRKGVAALLVDDSRSKA